MQPIQQIIPQIFPNKKATKNLAQITKRQLKYLHKWSKVVLNFFFLHCFTYIYILQHQPKLAFASLQSS